MKKILWYSVSFFLFSSIACSAYADKIIISGNPVILEQQGAVYYLPDKYAVTGSYFYVLVNGAKQVCYLNKQPALSALNTQSLTVNYRDSVMAWVCYPLDTNYFSVQ